jgi:hypothetical protein
MPATLTTPNGPLICSIIYIASGFTTNAAIITLKTGKVKIDLHCLFWLKVTNGIAFSTNLKADVCFLVFKSPVLNGFGIVIAFYS